VKAADKSLKKVGVVFLNTSPFFFKRFSAQGPRLNMKLFPGIGIIARALFLCHQYELKKIEETFDQEKKAKKIFIMSSN
jgi:hypothetical protein